MATVLAVLALACGGGEDSVFWNAAACGNHRGCVLTAPWPAPRPRICREVRIRG